MNKLLFPWAHRFVTSVSVHVSTLLFLSLAGSAAMAAPVYSILGSNPANLSGGFTVPVATCNDTNDFTPHYMIMTNDQIGVMSMTATANNNYVDVPILSEMNSVTNYGGSNNPSMFDATIYKRIRFRLKTDPTLSTNAGFYITWRFLTNNVNTEVFSFFGAYGQPFGTWKTYELDFSNDPRWTGDLNHLTFRPIASAANNNLADPNDIGATVLLNQINLVADNSSDDTFTNKYVLLNVIQRITNSSNGSLQSVYEDIAAYNAANPPAKLSGRVYYFAKGPGKDRIAITNYFNSTSKDYDDNDFQPSGYTPVGLLGYVWTKQYPGMAPVTRVLKNGHHFLVPPGGDLTQTGYTVDKILGYAYDRYEYPYEEYETTSDASDAIYELPSGGVTFGANLTHGAAGWHWYFGTLNGQPKQNCNVHDFGRQNQLSFYIKDPVTTSNANPSEVGYGIGQVGNPVAHTHVIGNTIVTRTVPIDWNVSNTSDIVGSTSHPDIWPGYILGKDVTFGILGLANVCKWTAYVYAPVGGSQQLEIFSGHPTADYTNRYIIDFNSSGNLIITGTDTDLSNSTVDRSVPQFGIGGTIAALGPKTTDLAEGLLFATYTNALGCPDYKYTFAGINQIGSCYDASFGGTALGSQHSSPFDSDVLAMRAVTKQAVVAGDNRYTVYVMSGTFNQVTNWMQTLYNNRAKLEW